MYLSSQINQLLVIYEQANLFGMHQVILMHMHLLCFLERNYIFICAHIHMRLVRLGNQGLRKNREERKGGL